MSTQELSTTTPMMQQWNECKEKAKGALLLFRLGDFYEAFYEDATLLSSELDLTLTQRQGIPMSGIPAQTLDNYLEKLINKGHLVAIADQIGDPKAAKGIVKRDITRIVSPATYFESTQDKDNHFFACIIRVNSIFGLAYMDITTGELKVSEFETLTLLKDELLKLKPKELLISRKFHKEHSPLFFELKLEFNFRINIKQEFGFDFHFCYEWLKDHFGVGTLDGFGLKHMTAAINAAGGLLTYISEDLNHDINHIDRITPVHLDKHMHIDSATLKHLDIMYTSSKEGFSLFGLLNQTKTAMGSRKMKDMVAHPLLLASEIEKRQEAIQELLDSPSILREALDTLTSIRDVERLIMRIVNNYSGPRDLKALGESLASFPGLKKIINSLEGPFFKDFRDSFGDFHDLASEIASAIVESPPLKITEGGIFKKGYHAALDDLIAIKTDSNHWLENYQEKLKNDLAIKTLKVGFNRAFGYFIEVSRLQSKNMPAHFHKRQTLVNTERFISEELKLFEDKMYSAEENISKLEYELFHQLRLKIIKEEKTIRKAAIAIANIDCIVALAVLAKSRGYTKPSIATNSIIEISQGRHPILELSEINEVFIPNDTYLDDTHCQMMLITGPNMAGKSTYIRQVALLCIMAQIGSFIPAKEAKMGVLDKVFSRIGASDDLNRGQSTFMVEMSETANILNNATSKSLVILDEIGRGTSTYDGVAIAWAVAEYLLSKEGRQAKTLFATHYHELTALADHFSHVKNYRIAVDESGESIVFLRTIVKGGSDKSYGIHVAKLAGLPSFVIQTAKDKLHHLQSKKPKEALPSPSPATEEEQFLLFPLKNSSPSHKKIVQELSEIDPFNMTPLQALELLFKWQKQLKN